jgi:DoxX-like family
MNDDEVLIKTVCLSINPVNYKTRKNNSMTQKTRNIINWVLAGLVAFIFIGSAASKLTADAAMVKQAADNGLNAATMAILGIIEIISVLLFLYPRTGVLGTLLLAAYMGGAIATHLQHSLPLAAPVGIAAFVWVVAVIRFPELTKRILGKT